MALRREYRKKFKNVELITGHFYKFKYQAWESDPKPTVIFMYGITGLHPNTGHQWRILQCINFTYIPKAVRKRFLDIWLLELKKGVNIHFTWERINSLYPWLKHATRRYFYSPTYYITNLEEIPISKVQKEVISTWSKDFSKKIKTAIFQKFRTAISNRFKKKKPPRR